MTCNRLMVIAHEDLDVLAAPHVVPFVATSITQAQARYSTSIGEARLMIGNCIRMMARAPKSRAGCHFGAAIGLRSMLEDFVPTIPDWANDQHTLPVARGASLSLNAPPRVPSIPAGGAPRVRGHYTDTHFDFSRPFQSVT
jgi:replication-associated recombination protein RarA